MSTIARPWAAAFSLLTAGLAACSSANDGPADATPVDAVAALDARAPDAAPVAHPDAAPTDDAAEEAEAGVEPDAGFDLTRDPSCPARRNYTVLYHGTVVDQAGAPVPAAKAQMCIHTDNGAFVCIPPADTGADGRFTVAVPDDYRCIDNAAMRMLLPLSRRGATYCKVPLSTTLTEVTATTAFALYDTHAPRTLPPLGDERARRTVVFDDGLELDMVPFDFYADYAALSAARVPLDHPGLCFLQGQAPFDGLYVVSPEGDAEGSIPVRIPNTTGLAANRAVRGYVLGTLGCMLPDGTLVPEAEWVEFGRGQVSADGRTINIAPGLPCLSWFAYRAE